MLINLNWVQLFFDGFDYGAWCLLSLVFKFDLRAFSAVLSEFHDVGG